MDATSKLSRRFHTGSGEAMLHTIEPSVIYEYVPATDQSNITQIDQVDDLPKKNLMTYMLRSRLLEQDGHSSFNWLDLTLAQSYHVGAVQTRQGISRPAFSLHSAASLSLSSRQRFRSRARDFPISGYGPSSGITIRSSRSHKWRAPCSVGDPAPDRWRSR